MDDPVRTDSCVGDPKGREIAEGKHGTVAVALLVKDCGAVGCEGCQWTVVVDADFARAMTKATAERVGAVFAEELRKLVVSTEGAVH